jgi:hypothetical protein
VASIPTRTIAENAMSSSISVIANQNQTSQMPSITTTIVVTGRTKMELILKSKIEDAKSHARDVFNKDKHHAAIFFLNLAGKVGIFPPWASNLEKDETATILKEMVKTQGLREYIFICEMWMAKGPAAMAHKRTGASLESMPGRIEALMVLYCNSKEETLSFAKITRDEEDNPTLSPWVEDTQLTTRTKHPFLPPVRFHNIWEQAAQGSN